MSDSLLFTCSKSCSKFSEPGLSDDDLLQQDLTTAHLQEMSDLQRQEENQDQAPSTKLSEKSKEKWAKFFEQKLQQLEGGDGFGKSILNKQS